MKNLTDLVVDIKLNKFWNKSTIAFLMDVASAYDNILSSILIQTLRQLGCPALLLRYLVQWSKTRSVQFVVDDDSRIQISE